MYYVYELSYNGKVFYVGCSKHPYQRYKEHCTNVGIQYTYSFIHAILEAGDMPTIEIIFHSVNKSDAISKEHETIYNYIEIGNKLCNRDKNAPHNTIYMDYVYKVKKFYSSKISNVLEYFNNYCSINNIK